MLGPQKVFREHLHLLNVNITFIYHNGVDTWCSQKLFLFLSNTYSENIGISSLLIPQVHLNCPIKIQKCMSTAGEELKLWIFLPSLEKTLELGG